MCQLRANKLAANYYYSCSIYETEGYGEGLARFVLAAYQSASLMPGLAPWVSSQGMSLDLKQPGQM